MPLWKLLMIPKRMKTVDDLRSALRAGLKRQKAALDGPHDPKTILFRVSLKGKKALGNCTHQVYGKTISPASLLISFRPTSADYRLEYVDEKGGTLTDTWHASINSAFEQAEFEYGPITDWVKIEAHSDA